MVYIEAVVEGWVTWPIDRYTYKDKWLSIEIEWNKSLRKLASFDHLLNHKNIDLKERGNRITELVLANGVVKDECNVLKKQIKDHKDKWNEILTNHEEERRDNFNDRKELNDCISKDLNTISQLKDNITTLTIHVTNLETSLETKNRLLDVENAAKVHAESRVTDLQNSLQWERKRLDEAIAYQRVVADGQRHRLGQAPDLSNEQSIEQKSLGPINTRRKPWRDVAREAEDRSKKPVPEVQRTEEHWKGKIAEVEAADKKNEGRTS